MFAPSKSAHVDLLDSIYLAREARQKSLRETKIFTQLQAHARGCLIRKNICIKVRSEFDALFSPFCEFDKFQSLPDAVQVFPTLKNFLRMFQSDTDRERFLCLCRYLLISIDNPEITKNFAVIALSKDSLLCWVHVIKIVLLQCCEYLRDLRPEMPSDVKNINLHLHLLISYTSCSTWAVLKTKQGDPFKPVLQQVCSNILNELVANNFFIEISLLLKKGLCRTKPALRATPLAATFNLIMRPIVACDFEENLLVDFIAHVLSIPGLIFHLKDQATECCNALLNHNIFTRCVELLNDQQVGQKILERLDGNCSLFVVANLIFLGFLAKEQLLLNILDFTHMATNLLEHCSTFLANKKNNMSHWHSILGWFSQPIEPGYQEAMPFVVEELKILWNGASVKFLFSDLAKSPLEFESDQNGQELLNKVFDQKTSLDSKSIGQQTLQRFGSAESTMLSFICTLYQKMFTTLKQLKYDILSGLCYQDFLLPRLWRFISSLGQQNGLKAFLELLAQNPKATGPEFNILSLFADCTTYLIVILDDMELYDQNKPFSIDTLKSIGLFCNWFVYKSIMDSLIDVKSTETHQLFNSVLGLLSLLCNRDSRRSFCDNPDFWLIKEIKPSHFLSELEKSNKKYELLIQKAPHILPHKERVVLFRKYVNSDKEKLGLQPMLQSHEFFDRPATSITVHRSRLVEDGYRQLSMLTIKALKGVIRVKFVNQQGLDEPGIDQDGVFKEFLEETIKKVFDPSLNLFKTTSESRLYPSSTSHVHENHLALFDFVGRMLGKAVYEGIVVESPFAFFVLNHFLGRVNSRIYSSMDVLPSLDPELYKSLTYIKHYDGDMRDLDLTFSVDEDFMGQMVSYELVPGGKAVVVTNENKISYIHLMAHFRLYLQIKDQLNAFVRGFRSVINPQWLCLFSAPELQKLISGDTEDVPMRDLKQHVQYYGGFHGNHKVIVWLWDILENDFNPEERRLFLKFVTSCSKPPLLGFAYLVPPFSIRCVEVADDQDEGDTLGSVIRGFLAIRRKDPVGRLPTASTCFNLLKLPNYQKKSTLREKLRYAIRAGSGFELS